MAARVVDLSQGGAKLLLVSAPAWRLDDLAGRKARLRLAFDLGSHGHCACAARLVRVATGEFGCEMGVKFAKIGREDRARLRAYLDRLCDVEAGESIRRHYRRHLRRRRHQAAAALSLAAITGIALTVLCVRTPVTPEDQERIKGALRRMGDG